MPGPPGPRLWARPVPSTTAPPPLRAPSPAVRAPWRLAAIASIPALLGVWLGYGTDTDTANILRAGQSALDGDYGWSRPPGVYVHEATTRLLDLAGGPVLVNLSSVLAGLLTLAALGWLLREEGRDPRWSVVILVSSPWWWVASTSLGDYLWALAALLGGAVATRREARILAGLAFGLAVHFRLSSLLLVGAWLLAEHLGEPDRRPALRTTATTAAIAIGTAIILFVPSWLAADRTLAFLNNEFEVTGLVTLVGRWGVKNLAFFGPLFLLVLLTRIGPLVHAASTWRTSTLVRFGLLGFAISEALYLRFPWKPLHLLPALLGIVLVVSASEDRWLRRGLVAASLVHALVTVTVAAPDTPHEATTGRLSVGITAGVLVHDVRCRLDDRDRGPWPDDPASAEAGDRAYELWDCQTDLWRGE